VAAKPGAWLWNAKSRRGGPAADQLAAPAKLGMDRAGPMTIPQAASDSV
jgi:hypothetical protein